ncbi:MAG: helix-turn-helix domain-containing protein [Gemmiger sp.]
MKKDIVSRYEALLRAHVAGKISNQEMIEEMRRDGLVGENFYQECEMNSDYVDTHEDVSFSRDVVQLHSHTFHELIYCCSGNIQYLLGTERYRVQRGDVIIIPPGASHRPLYLEQLTEPYRRYVLWVSPRFVSEMSALWPSLFAAYVPHTLLRTAGTGWEFIGELFRRGVEENDRRAPGWEACVYGNSIVLVTQLLRAFREEKSLTPIPEKRELLDEVMSYIEAHLADKITLEGTARHFLVSESTISQTFRQKMGVSFYRCVTQRRLIAAKTLILDGAVLDEAGQQVGFADYSTFYRAFKREYGVSPLQYRKMQAPALGE